MYKGYTGKVLHIDLNGLNISIETPDEKIYRKYLGGSCLGVYYALKMIPAKVDPLSPENVIVFSIGPVTGARISGATRHNVTAKSPLTGGIGTGEAGGYWASELRYAGFDAIVIKGRAAKPVYLWIHDGEVEIRDASHLWGKVTKEAQTAIREELDDPRIRVAQIGPAGENLVKYACIVNELSHFNGRNGLGAVMGSKNLKAIAVRGTLQPVFENPEFISQLALVGAEKVKNDPGYIGFKQMGTNVNVDEHIITGGMPTRNWTSGYFEDTEKLLSGAWTDTYIKPGTCYACVQSCKRNIKNTDVVDPDYGGPEYETVGMVGSNLGIGDKLGIIRINEMCSKYTMDTISFGGVVGFLMECYEKGIITKNDTDGLELTFGNVDAVVKLAEKAAMREGFGDLVAEGTRFVAEKLGPDAQPYAVHVKGKEFPAHMPHVKASLSLAYATVPFGADHVSSHFDAPISEEPIAYQLRSFGFDTPVDARLLSDEKARLFWLTQRAYSLFDTLPVCCLTFSFWTIYDLNDLTNLVNAATGMKTHLSELLEVGERRIIMMRSFNEREGFTSKHDMLPPRLFNDPLKGGPTDGAVIDEEAFIKVRDLYYEMAGLDEEGRPTKAKKVELGLGWIDELPS